MSNLMQSRPAIPKVVREVTPDIIRAYRRGKSVDDIRKEYKLSRKLIYSILDSNGVTPGRVMDLATENAVVKAYRDGVPSARIRRTFDLTGLQLRSIIKRRAISGK